MTTQPHKPTHRLDDEPVAHCEWLTPNARKSLLDAVALTVGKLRDLWKATHLPATKGITETTRRLIAARLSSDIICPACGSLQVIYMKGSFLACEKISCGGMRGVTKDRAAILAKVLPQRVSK
jgi:hypothetical protein